MRKKTNTGKNIIAKAAKRQTIKTPNKSMAPAQLSSTKKTPSGRTVKSIPLKKEGINTVDKIKTNAVSTSTKKTSVVKTGKLNSTKKETIKTPAKFPVVAIGASAGGLEAITELLKNLPADTGMSFIVVQHLSPDHKSLLTQLLTKATTMKVQEIDDMDLIKPDNVFIIPSNKGIEVTDGHIKLIPRSENSIPVSIDVLFSSLAHAQKERVIGVILSGNASDGTAGMKAIKHEGGLTFAQDNSAKFVSMPQSAIEAGVVDFILSPKEIALELSRLSKHPFVNNKGTKTNKEDLIDNNNPDLKLIISNLLKVTGVDFSGYKMNTIKRRIIRRMVLYKINSLKEYAQFLSKKNEETDILYQDLLINVTSFFRDTETHKFLKENLFPKLLKRKKAGETLRIWVSACASGEEAYSIAMMLLELEDANTNKIPIQIFATDLSAHTISKARIGLYSKQELDTVSPKRLQRFFNKSDGAYRINKSVRDMCVFAPHNVLHDPPFSRLDFISCCNLFIYFDTAAQKKVIQTFHYALNDDCFLMLGKSETISTSANLFAAVNKKYKIFSRKKNLQSRAMPIIPSSYVQGSINKKTLVQNNPDMTKKVQHKKNNSYKTNSLDNAIDEVLMTDFMPASVAINYQMEIVQFRGNTNLYLTHPKGKATFNIVKMARPEIAFEMRNTIAKAIKLNKRIIKSGIEIKKEESLRIISIEALPFKIDSEEPLVLIVFSEQEILETFSTPEKKGNNKSLIPERRIKKLEEELASAHADALVFSQEQEAYTEELQSANEEVVSSNEEMQTMNEELETSKEEIQSANEELITTNQELQTRNDLLNESYEYSEAIISTMHEPMLVLDKNLRVKSANNSFYKKFKVTPEDTEGMLLYDLGNMQWNIPRLRELLNEIIPSNATFFDFEIVHNFLNIGEKIMLLNARRVVQKTHREQLILLSISDITELRKLLLEKETRENEIHKQETIQQNKHAELLEELVKKRTIALKQANHELEKMNIELQSFTFISSHDLQEPLRKIQTLIGRILEKENNNLSDKGKNYFKLITTSADRMRQLIQDLLEFSRLNSTQYTFEKTDLNLIVEEVKKELKDTIEEKHAGITVSQLCDINVIPFQFQKLMHNLISNSLKFSDPKRTPHITIESSLIKSKNLKIEMPTPHKQYCLITVTDNGIGFEKEFSKKIFEVFQRLHNRDDYEGTGIGLAIVKKIVDIHSGVIIATGSLMKGAKFEIYLPA